ncbi:MAG: V-type ATP synthase subunit F [Candidatus Heimdallarchaeota archaeon]|nr:MAG: V-type ATP synthase subunit F [Candidatus Heimdallarchaeota archaeon]
MYITAIGDPETCDWLKLAGIGEVYPLEEDHENPFEILSSLWLRKDISIILITPDIAERYHQEITEFIAKNPFPIIMELPIKQKDVKDPLTELIRQAVGINLEL